MNVVALDNASMTFDGRRGLDTVCAEISAGQSLAVLGASGSGKSTLLRLIAGVAAPTSGVVRTLGHDATRLAGAQLRRHRARIGVLHQTDNLTPGLRVVHNVLMGNLGRWSSLRALLALVRPTRSDVRAATEALARVELSDRLWSWPGELSGGERQRVAFARLVVQKPDLWIADEPTAGLDQRLRREVLVTMLALAREQGATVVVALHDLDLLDVGFDEVWGLREGRLTIRGSPSVVDASAAEQLYDKEQP